MENNNVVGSMLKNIIICVVIITLLGTALSFMLVATKPAIMLTEQERTYNAYKKCVPDFDSFEDVTYDVVGAGAGLNAHLAGEKAVLVVKNKNDEVVGFIVRSVGSGYGGDLNIMTGLDKDLNIINVVYEKTPTETPGIGMRTVKDEYLARWKNVNDTTIENVDGISGATITSTGFKEAVKVALMYASRAKSLITNS